LGLLDLFTGDASAKAAKNNQYAIATGEQQGGNALMTSGQNALQYLLGAPGQAGALQVTDRGYDQASSALTGQYGQTQNYLSQLGRLYQPETQMGQGALTRYLNATGANGAAGSTQAQQDFTAAPGYQYALNQALGGVQRSAAARGGLAGGNATQDILSTATGLANQGYQQYVNNLGNASQYYSQGIAGQAGALQGQAQASQGYGNALGALDTGRGSALAGTLGQAAGVQQGIGQGIAGLANSTTNALVQNNNNLAQSENAAGANILSGILGIGQLAAGAGGSAVGGVTGAARGGGNIFSGIGSGLKSLFS
jgi:hypothetical protein